jgi:hypothetical protein
MPDKAITYWHLAGKSSVAKSAVREATAQLRRGLSLLDGLPETRERKQLELDIHVTLTAALMAGKGFADPEAVAALERANRLVTETGAVGSPLHFSVLYGLWVSTFAGGTVPPRSSTPPTSCRQPNRNLRAARSWSAIACSLIL